MSSARPDVCVAVISDLSFDARVWKEVRTLLGLGLRVRLIGCAYELTAPRRTTDGRLEVVEIPLGTRGSASVVGRLKTLVRVWKEIVRARADVYHAHNIHVGPPALVVSRVRRAMLVYDAHELYGEVYADASVAQRLVGRLSAFIEKQMVRRGDHVITTNASRAAILGRAYGRDDIVVLENVPARRDEIVPLDPGFPTGVDVLLYQGGIYARERAFRETIEALQLLPDLHFAVLGFGRDDDLELIRRWAVELGVADRVHLYPPRPFDELVSTAAAATVGIVPIYPLNQAYITGDTNKLFEYLMAGLPVVGSDLPEIRRAVTATDPPAGALFDPRSAASIADAIQSVLRDPDAYDAHRRSARSLALERYNWGAQEHRLRDIYGARVPVSPGDG